MRYTCKFFYWYLSYVYLLLTFQMNRYVFAAERSGSANTKSCSIWVVGTDCIELFSSREDLAQFEKT